MAEISVMAKTATSVTLYLTNLDTSWSNGERLVTWSLDGQTKTSTLPDGVASGGEVTFDGLKADTTYQVSCTINLGSTTKTLSGSVKTDSASSIAKWKWNDANGLATPTQIARAYNAVVNKTETTNFNWLVWDDLVDKVKQLTDATMGWWDEDYASYKNTKVDATQILTSDMFNSLRNNLELVGLNYAKLGYRTGIGAVSAGDIVYGDYFITLTDYINDCIDKL
jgi:hypothetical protein